jgi:hypothetical protein
MIYSDYYKFIYISIPKTASASVSDILINYYKAKNYGNRHDSHIPLSFSEYFIFATVRNPYYRALSGYKSILAHKNHEEFLPITSCLGKFHFVSMQTFLRNEVVCVDPVPDSEFSLFQTNEFGPKIDRFIKVESLGEEFGKLPFVNKNVEIPTINKSLVERIPTSLLYRIYDFVESSYRSDFEMFGYEIAKKPFVTRFL